MNNSTNVEFHQLKAPRRPLHNNILWASLGTFLSLFWVRGWVDGGITCFKDWYLGIRYLDKEFALSFFFDESMNCQDVLQKLITALILALKMLDI